MCIAPLMIIETTLVVFVFTIVFYTEEAEICGMIQASLMLVGEVEKLLRTLYLG